MVVCVGVGGVVLLEGEPLSLSLSRASPRMPVEMEQRLSHDY